MIDSCVRLVAMTSTLTSPLCRVAHVTPDKAY